MEVHPENFRCMVAALRAPGWFRHYQGLKRLASSGRAFLGNIWKFNGRVDEKEKKHTPWKINMDHNHGGLVQIIFLSERVICRFHVWSCMVMYGLGGGNSNVCYFHHLLGEDEPILTNISQMGLKPPTSSLLL